MSTGGTKEPSRYNETKNKKRNHFKFACYEHLPQSVLVRARIELDNVPGNRQLIQDQSFLQSTLWTFPALLLRQRLQDPTVVSHNLVFDIRVFRSLPPLPLSPSALAKEYLVDRGCCNNSDGDRITLNELEP